MLCTLKPQAVNVPGIWNPLPAFDTVKQDNQLNHIQSVDNFLAAAKNGTLPDVSWIVPDQTVSEHPPASIHAGQAYITSIINAIMQSPDWDSTAIFLAWDDWGGFYDNVVPPVGGRERLWLARPRPRHQPIREERLHRPANFKLRRLPEIRGRSFPQQSAA